MVGGVFVLELRHPTWTLLLVRVVKDFGEDLLTVESLCSGEMLRIDNTYNVLKPVGELKNV